MIYIGENTGLHLEYKWIHFEPVAADAEQVKVIDSRTEFIEADGSVGYGWLAVAIEKFCEAIAIITEQYDERANY